MLDKPIIASVATDCNHHAKEKLQYEKYLSSRLGPPGEGQIHFKNNWDPRWDYLWLAWGQLVINIQKNVEIILPRLRGINFNNLVSSPICLSHIKYQVFTSKGMQGFIGYSYILLFWTKR